MVLGLAVWGGMAAAEDRVLILANENYRDAADIAGAADVAGAAQALTAAGFAVTVGRDLAAPAMRQALSDLLVGLEPGDRVVIALAGHFAKGGAETWALGTEASLPDLAQAGGVGLSVATVLAVAAEAPGRSLVLLGTESSRLPLGRGLEQGFGALDVPQGVTVARGEAGEVATFLRGVLGERDASLPELLDKAPALTAEGFLAAGLTFRETEVLTPPAMQTAEQRAAEDAVWAAVQKAPTIAGYEDYLLRYPSGRYAGIARAEAARLRADPGVQARLAEEALGLNRDQRRAIQRQLSILGFDPRGIDGLFGNGSRAAIQGWQQANAERATGFLTRDQLLRLTAQADRRSAELEAEAAARRAEQERQDRLYWDQTGAKGDEPGLRAYVKRYPDGLFAELAAERLAAIEAARRAEAAAQDRQAWDRARAADTADAYRAYLAIFPNGSFAAEAQARIDALDENAADREARRQAEAAEAALGLNAVTRKLVEERLASLDLRPGEADGVFDDKTRRAIRRFQASRGMVETGYLDQAALVALLAGGVLRMGE
jgi:peptidoglycan hydrolase-like protein with peptidoglycan-binding domain